MKSIAPLPHKNGSRFRVSFAACLVGALVVVVTIALVSLAYALANIQVVA